MTSQDANLTPLNYSHILRPGSLDRDLFVKFEYLNTAERLPLFDEIELDRSDWAIEDFEYTECRGSLEIVFVKLIDDYAVILKLPDSSRTIQGSHRQCFPDSLIASFAHFAFSLDHTLASMGSS